MDANIKCVGVIGATSLVGRSLLPRLTSGGYEVKAFTRQETSAESMDGVEWLKFADPPESQECQSQSVDTNISCWICLAPAWVLSEYYPMLEAYGVRRILVLSSTSIFTKNESDDPGERETASMLAEAEASLRTWAEWNGVEWLVLRPTLIYGLGRDKNISEIARYIRRFGFFPLVGKGQGRRQPVCALDVADACVALLENIGIVNRAYNIAGGETLTYREMVERVFAVLERPARFVSVPLWFFRASIFFLRIFPRYRHWTASMAMRMNQDLVFDNSDAERDFLYSPRSFLLKNGDVFAEKVR